jgi:hypothetical protein
MSIRIWSVALATAALFAIPVTAAMASPAGDNPSPSPTCTDTLAPSPYDTPSGPTPDFGYNPCPTPTPPVKPKCPLIVNGIPQPLAAGTDLSLCRGIRQEDFWVDVNSLNPDGSVLATGPVHFNVGRDITISPTRDIFRQFFNSVNVLHPALSGAVVDRAACTITLDQNDQTWRFLRGTGFFRNAIGAGVYDLRGEFSFPTRYFRCSLPVGLSSGQAAWDLNHGGIGLPAPFAFDIAVNATGWARVRPFLFPVFPEPSPSPSYVSPTS